MTGSTPHDPSSSPPLDDLRRRWRDLVAEIGASRPRATTLGDDLLARYQEPHRHHHDLSHLAEVLATLDQLASPDAPDPATRLAAWFHDAVYRGAPDDEERSADLADRALRDVGATAPLVDAVATMVRATAGHLRPDDVASPDQATALLLDADLSVLAAPPARYDRYAEGVRREHPDVDDAAFAAGRARALRTLLDRPHLFHTDRGRRQLEPAARTNLRRELADLSAPDD